MTRIRKQAHIESIDDPARRRAAEARPDGRRRRDENRFFREPAAGAGRPAGPAAEASTAAGREQVTAPAVRRDRCWTRLPIMP